MNIDYTRLLEHLITAIILGACIVTAAVYGAGVSDRRALKGAQDRHEMALNLLGARSDIAALRADLIQSKLCKAGS